MFIFSLIFTTLFITLLYAILTNKKFKLYFNKLDNTNNESNIYEMEVINSNKTKEIDESDTNKVNSNKTDEINELNLSNKTD